MSEPTKSLEFIEDGVKLCELSVDDYDCVDCPEYESCQVVSMEDYDETAEGDEDAEVSYSLEGDWD